jgi:hypothetical protein
MKANPESTTHIRGVAEEFKPDHPQVPDDQIDHQPVQAQAELEGKEFHRHPGGRKDIPVAKKRVRIVTGINPQTGLREHRSIHNVPSTIEPSDFPHLTIPEGKTQDISDEGPRALTTVLRHGSSTSGVDLDEQTLARGGGIRDTKSRKLAAGYHRRRESGRFTPTMTPMPNDRQAEKGTTNTGSNLPAWLSQVSLSRVPPRQSHPQVG